MRTGSLSPPPPISSSSSPSPPTSSPSSSSSVQGGVRCRHWDEEGCFVYKVIFFAKVGIRNEPSVKEDSKIGLLRSFNPGDLVSIDLIRHATPPTPISTTTTNTMTTSDNDNNTKKQKKKHINGPYLRLSDGSGWLFEYKHGEQAMKRMHVQLAQPRQPVWTFYGDNYPSGIGLRDHPNDYSVKKDKSNANAEVILPMQQVYCDAKVIHDETGVCFYRVQGTKQWIFDRRIDETTKTVTTMLLPPTKVTKGLFAYKCIENVGIRSKPSIDDDTRTTRIMEEGDICVANVIRQDVKDTNEMGGKINKKNKKTNVKNGPYIRLTDGSGWLFVNRNNTPMMEEVYIQTNQEWRFEVVAPNGITLRKQPNDRKNNNHSNNDDSIYEIGSIITCDAKIINPTIKNNTRTNFYRVKGTDGWVYDKRGSRQLIKPYLGWYQDENDTLSGRTTATSAATSTEENGWTIGFIRGVALAFSDTLYELEVIEQSHIIAFSKQQQYQHQPQQPLPLPTHGDDRTEPIRINIYYKTRTIGICMDHPIQGKIQILCKDCSDTQLLEIFRNPIIHGIEKNIHGCHQHQQNTNATTNNHNQRVRRDVAVLDEDDNANYYNVNDYYVNPMNNTDNHDDDDDDNNNNNSNDEILSEIELRQRLMQYDMDIQSIQSRKVLIQRTINMYDTERYQEELVMENKRKWYWKQLANELALEMERKLQQEQERRRRLLSSSRRE